MVQICPTVTAFDTGQFDDQLARVGFAPRLHVDLMDGDFAPSKSPDLDEIKLPAGRHIYDIHLMYRRPLEQLEKLVAIKPNMVIIHAEADVDHAQMAAQLHDNGIKAGLALLASTKVESVEAVLADFDQTLVFSGHLGYHGGVADLSLLDKARQIRTLNPDIELAWDGGINDQNARALAEGGVQVLNVGGFIQKSSDPVAAYAQIEAAIAT